MTAGRPGFRSGRCPCGYRWEDCPNRDVLGPGRGATGREPATGALRASAAVLLLALTATPASAAHCDKGQIWRVHLDQCVDIDSVLARAYVHQVRRAPRPLLRRVADEQSRNDSAPPPAEPPPAPTPAPPQPYFEDTRVGSMPLPDIDDGAPAIWRLCQAAPNLCRAADR
jgi:hypothetical protein